MTFFIDTVTYSATSAWVFMWTRPPAPECVTSAPHAAPRVLSAPHAAPRVMSALPAADCVTSGSSNISSVERLEKTDKTVKLFIINKVAMTTTTSVIVPVYTENPSFEGKLFVEGSVRYNNHYIHDGKK